MSGVESFYVDERPLHCVDPDNSLIRVMSYEEYLKLPAAKLHEYLVRQNIVVRGTPTESHNFDAQGLSFMRPLHSIVPLQGN